MKTWQQYLADFALAWRVVVNEKCLRCTHRRGDHCEGGGCNVFMPRRPEAWEALPTAWEPCRCLRFADSWVDQTPSEYWR